MRETSHVRVIRFLELIVDAREISMHFSEGNYLLSVFFPVKYFEIYVYLGVEQFCDFSRLPLHKESLIDAIHVIDKQFSDEGCRETTFITHIMIKMIMILVIALRQYRAEECRSQLRS